jgi:hypothetical protein
MSKGPDYSVVMLVENGAADFSGYLLELHGHLDRLGLSHELLLAVNGNGAFARGCLQSWPEGGPVVQVIELTHRVSSGICLQTVLGDCRGETLIVCGPYRQIGDSGFEALLQAVSEGGADLALPWRQGRVDPVVNQWQSRLFNALVRRLTGSDIHDLSSTLRVVRRVVLEETPLYGDLYRYLPLLAKKRGFKVREIPAPHARELGEIGYFGLSVYVNRFVDLLAIRFNLGFARKPLRYFGMRGVLLLLAGALCLTSAVVLKVAGDEDLGNSALLIIGLVLFLTGSGLWGVGLLGEILAFTLGRKHKDYVVEKILE